MIEFRSRHASLLIPLPNGTRVSFSNGVFRTEDESIIKALRHICTLEASGNNRMIEESIYSDDTMITGIIHLELIGVPHYKLVVEGCSLKELVERIKAVVEMPLSHTLERRETFAPANSYSTNPVMENPAYAPDFVSGGALPAIIAPVAKAAVKVKSTLPTVRKLRTSKEKINAS